MEMDIQIFGKQRLVLCAGKARLLLVEICPDKRAERRLPNLSQKRRGNAKSISRAPPYFFPFSLHCKIYGSRNVCLLLKVHLNPGVGISGNWVVTQFFWRQDDDTVVDRKLKLGTFVSTPP